jgi:hypothetical protein
MLLCIISFLGYRVLIRGFRRASRSILLSFSCSALQASLLPSKTQANASKEEAAENRTCREDILSLWSWNIDIPSPTPPFGKTCQVFPCLLLLGIAQASLALLSLTRSLGKGRGLVAD